MAYKQSDILSRSAQPSGSQSKLRGKKFSYIPDLDASLSLIVHSHLRWDFVWQRPQQILSRLAESYPVLFVEEPIFDAQSDNNHLATLPVGHNVTRVIPHLSRSLAEQGDLMHELVRDLLLFQIQSEDTLRDQFSRPIQWFYNPMPTTAMLGHFNEAGVVYDCMDELSKFRFAPSNIVRREEILLDAADIVFTGGYKLYESKSHRHDNVHFFGCGVDVEHFARACAEETVIPADLANIRGPVLGFYGVIDERLDYELLARLAAARPDWSIAMVGPVVKVDPAELPQADNIHWLGQKDFDSLPAYAKGFDLCLMPFALNEATEYINPTKALEYMAAGKPILSTAVADVVRNFTPVAQVAYSHEEFIRMAQEMLERPAPDLISQGLARAQGATWTAIVSEMDSLMRQAVMLEASAGSRDGKAEAASV